MLSKLIKHEFKATAKLLLPLYLIVMVFTLMDRIVLNLHIFKGALLLIPGFITGFYVVSLIAAAIVTSILMIYRFYKNLLSDEGYLMFTLPAKPRDLINSKLIVSVLWTIASMIIIVFSLFFVFLTPENTHEIINGFHHVMNELHKQFGSNLILLIIEYILLCVIGLFSNFLLIYLSIALGQLFRGHRVLGSFVSYIGITTVLQIISMVFFVLIGFASSNITEVTTIPNLFFPISIVITLIMNVVFYFLTNYLFERKLNLE